MQHNTAHWAESFKLEYAAYPFFTSVYLEAAKPQENAYYLQWNDFLNYFKDGTLIGFKPKQSLLELGRKVIKETQAGNPGYLHELQKVHREILAATEACLTAREESVLPDISEWWPPVQRALSHATALLFQADYAMEEFLQNIKQESEKEYQSLKKSFLGTHVSFLNKANYRLVELARNEQDFETVYRIFKKEYGWFLNSYAGVFQVTPIWLKEYVEKIKHEHPPLASHEDPINGSYASLVLLTQEMSVFRDDKKKLLLIVVELLDRWLKDYSAIHNQKYEKLRWLTIDEILSEKIRNVSAYASAGKRVGVMNAGGYEDTPEQVAVEVMNMFVTENSGEVLKGMTAFPGVVTGRVKIIIDPMKDGGKLLPGEILVTSMTKPEFLPLLGKVAAFITDQGGIASHAAIVAREMKKPCIVGTQVATKVLKDGDMVEVDAEKGIVRKI